MQITGETFNFPFKTANWKGVAAFGGMIGLVGTVLFPLLYLLNGFGLRVMRQTMRGEEPSLPQWENWGQIFRDTVWYGVVMIVYLLPAGLILGVVWMAMFLLISAGPMLFVPGSGQISPQAEGLMMFMTIFMTVVMMVASLIGTLLILPLYFFASVALTRAVAHNSLSRAFEVKNVWALLREGFANFLVAFLFGYAVQMGINFAAAMLSYTIILSCFYPILFGLGMMYGSLIMFALFGRAYREAQGKMAAAGVIA